MSRRNGGESPLRFEWERAVRALPLPPMTKLVALTLATYGDLHGHDVRPGSAALIDDTGTSRASVWRALAELRDVGLIVSVGGANRRRGLAEVYRLEVPADVLARCLDRVANRPARRPDQGSVRALVVPDQGSQGNNQGSVGNRSGLSGKHDGAHTEPPPEHDQLSDQHMTRPSGRVVEVTHDRARPLNGHPVRDRIRP